MGNVGGKRKDKTQRAKEKKDMAKSGKIDQKNYEDSLQEKKVIKLLLLGAGESGKSTLFKQTQSIYGKGFDRQTLESYTQIIHRNVLQGMYELVRQSDLLGSNCRTQADSKTAKDAFLALSAHDLTEGKVSPAMAEHVIKLWADAGIRACYDERAKFQLPDSASYFFQADVVPRVAKDDYVPIYEDILRCRSRTTGIVETEFVIKNDHFKIMDVGGQRSERKKWIHCFEDVTAVIFVAAINEYDQVLFEDAGVNRVHEALELFDKTCNSKAFGNASIILFLNKRDLFEQKIKSVDMKCCFEDYKGGCDYEEATRFLIKKFESQNKQPKIKIYTHITCATDTDNVKFTFNSVKKIVIETSLQKSGLA